MEQMACFSRVQNANVHERNEYEDLPPEVVSRRAEGGYWRVTHVPIVGNQIDLGVVVLCT